MLRADADAHKVRDQALERGCPTQQPQRQWLPQRVVGPERRPHEESVRGSDAFVIQSHQAPVNEWLMEQLIMVDALKRASAKRITVVAPCYPYARQDKKHLGREPISARLIADLYWAAGADRIMSVDLHLSLIHISEPTRPY